jgi:hypothetical protein
VSVDIYQNKFIPQEEIERAEKKYKDKQPNVWNAEYMAIFVQES